MKKIFIAGFIAIIAGVSFANAQIAPQINAPRVNNNNAVKSNMVVAPTDYEAEFRKLKARYDALTQENANLKNQITQYTSLGGSLVHAYCTDNISHTTAGAQQDCTDAGYSCQPITGLCNTRCYTQDDCAPSHLCDDEKHVCVLNH